MSLLIRFRCLTDGTDIPPVFWMMVTMEEFYTIMRNGGYLNKSLTKLLWGLLGRTDPPDTYGPILLYKSDVEDTWPPSERKPPNPKLN